MLVLIKYKRAHIKGVTNRGRKWASLSLPVCLPVCLSAPLSVCFFCVFNESFHIINTTSLHDKPHRLMLVLINYKRVPYYR